MAHAPGRGADRAPGAGHREDDGLGDLIEDHPPALDIAEPAQAERAELRLQQIANLVEPVLALVDPGPRVGAGIRQEPHDALRRDVRRVHLDRQEQPVRIQQTAEQARRDRPRRARARTAPGAARPGSPKGRPRRGTDRPSARHPRRRCSSARCAAGRTTRRCRCRRRCRGTPHRPRTSPGRRCPWSARHRRRCDPRAGSCRPAGPRGA